VSANAIAAYDAGASGSGIKIGIIDSGINPSLAEFAGRIDPASGDVVGSRGVSDEGGHGTAVSAVAAAARNGVNTLGVAFNATIVSERADDPGSCAGADGCQFYDSDIAAGIDAARVAGVRVINMSLGGDAPGPELLAAINHAVSAGIVFVISAGNDGDKPEGVNPDPFGLTAAQNSPGMVIIAGSVGVPDGAGGVDVSQISDFSNRAGTGSAYYLMAQGYRDRAPDETGTEFLWSGTSFSAPTIAGAVALLAQAFPQLTGAKIVDLLLRTGDDLGATGTDSIYGHGRLNIARAFSPQGQTSLAGSQTPISLSSNGYAPAASGDAVSANSMGAIILDGYDRAYVLNLAATLQQARQSTRLFHALQGGDLRSGAASAGPISLAMTVTERHDLAQGFGLERLGIGPEDAQRARLVAGSAIARLNPKTSMAFGFSEGATAMQRRLRNAEPNAFLIATDVGGEPGFDAKRDGSVALRREFGRFGVTVAGETGNVWQDEDARTSAFGSPYRYTSISVDRSFGGNSLTAGMSRLEEKQTLLGGRMGSALGGGGSSTTFLDLEARHDFGRGWSAGLTARHGWTSFAAGSFQTGAYGIDLSKLGVLGNSDTIGFRLAQPLRVESGGFAMLLPTGYDYSTQTATTSLSRFSLTPSGREVDAELSYGSSLLDGKGWLGANLFARRQPGHIAGAENDIGAAMRFTLGF
jgi:hypothetical protein